MSSTQRPGPFGAPLLARVPRLLPRTASGRIIAVLLFVKVSISIVNSAAYPSGMQYDVSHHAWRARSAGLEMGKMAYNSPLYYLPLLPFVDLSRFYAHGTPLLDVPNPKQERPANLRLLGGLRALNVVYVAGAYLVWIAGILPLLAGSRKSWLLASLLLLALPGVQKAAVMAHPDVLLLFLASLTFWLSIRWLPGPPRFGRNLTLAVLAGLTGACRPFAVVPMLFCWALNVGMLLRPWLAEWRADATRRLGSSLRWGSRCVAVSLISAGLCTSWWVYRYAHTGHLMNAYSDDYIAQYEPLRKDFDFGHYYSSFYFEELLRVPSRADVGNTPSLARTKANSFWTQLYSEVWGDHYQYFSGPARATDNKVWVKRTLFVVALPLTLLLGAGVLMGTLRIAKSALGRRSLLDPALCMAGIFWLGFGLFLYWQGTAGLLPGKNSTIKFLYIAWMCPFAIGVAASQRTGRAWFWFLLACELIVFCMALPMAQYAG